MRKLTLLLILALLPILANAQADPCSAGPKQKQVISQAASAKIIPLVAGSRVIICHIHFVTALANNVALIEGTGALCVTGATGMAGGATAATGWNLGANGFINLGNSRGTVADTATAGNDVCLLQSAATQVSGVVYYVRSTQ